MRTMHIFDAADYPRRNPALPQATVTVKALPPLPARPARFTELDRKANRDWLAPRTFAVFSQNN